jgi:adenine-specific DNA-methyltransferase
MAPNKLQKLELTWIGKGDEPKLEPRILIENPEFSYGDPRSENMLIHGDNLLALKALEQDYAGKVKCICIDPPYNTGSAFEHYDDGVEHSLWLELMSTRIKQLHKLLSYDGTIWIAIDDNEVHYLKVMCDEILGRQNFVTGIAWRSADSSNNDSKKFSIDHNTILVYSKNPDWLSYQLERNEESNSHYKNPDNDPKGPWFPGNLSSPNPRQNLRYELISPSGHVISPPANGWRWSKERMNEMINDKEIVFTNNNTKVLKKTYLCNQKGLAPSSIWFDIDETGHNRQAKYELIKLFPNTPTSELFKTPKPEKLIAKILKISTKPNDIVLDSFLGSGTTAAVAHKMGRRYIGIELGEHAKTHCYPRLKQVVDGEQGGISKAVNWQGGGGFKFYTLAPSMLQKDKYGNWVIDSQYNPTMLAAAMAKQEGFKYQPHDSLYWKQGTSSGQDFIYTTTQFITVESLDQIQEEMQPSESLLICCKSFQNECKGKYNNITIKKIPQMLLGRCEFGKEDYSLNIVNMPVDETVNDNDAEAEAEAEISIQEINEKSKKKNNSQPTLFD